MNTFTSTIPTAVANNATRLKLRISNGAERDILFMYLPKGNDQKKMLGKGAFGHVYSAYDFEEGKNIAIKEFKLEDNVFDTMRSDARELIPINLQHKNIVNYIGYAFHQGNLKLFMEQIDGGTLAKLCKKHPLATDITKLRDFTLQLIDGLTFLHDKNIIHRDIKGDNILVAHGLLKHQLKIADFGACRRILELYKGKRMEGTLPYMAPEVIKDRLYSAKSDVWALGCTVIEMIQGHMPHHTLLEEAGHDYAKYRLLQSPQKPSVPEELPDDVKSFIDLCTLMDHEARPEVASMLTHCFVKDLKDATPDVKYVEYKPLVQNHSEVRRDLKLNQELPRKIQIGVGTRQSIHSRTLVNLGDITSIEQLSEADLDSADNIYLQLWLRLALRFLKETQIHDPRWVETILVIVGKVDGIFSRENMGPELLEDLFSAYTLSLCLVYMALFVESSPKLKDTKFVRSISHIHKQAQARMATKTEEADYCVEAPGGVMCKCEKILEKLVDQKRWNKASKRQKRHFGITRKSSTREDIRYLIEKLISTPSEPENSFMEKLCRMEPSLEKILCIAITGMMGTRNEVALRLFKGYVQRCFGEIKDETWIAVLIAETYVWLLEQAQTVEECEAILGQNVMELGLQGYLMEMKETELYSDVIYVCLDLLYHQCGKVRNEIDTLSGDASLNPISLAYHRRVAQRLLREQMLTLEPGGENSHWATSFVLKGRFGNILPVEVKLWRKKNPQNKKEIKAVHEDNKFHDKLLQHMISVSSETHKTVCQVLAFQSRNDPVLLVLETVKKRQNLGRYVIERRNTFPELSFNEMLENFAVPAIDAIAFCHRKGVILRNLTADSFITEKGNDKGNLKLYLLDMASRPNEKEEILGINITKGEESEMQAIPLLFSAPETIIASINSIESDCYMLGHTIIQILTMGCQPFYYEEHQTAEEDCIQVLCSGRRPVRPGCIPEGVYKIIRPCFSSNLCERPSAENLLQQLQEFKSKTGQSQDYGTRRKQESFEPPNMGNQPEDVLKGIPVKLKRITEVLDEMRTIQKINVPNVLRTKKKTEMTSRPVTASVEYYPDTPICVAEGYIEVPVFKFPGDAHMETLQSLRHKHVALVNGATGENSAKKISIGPTGTTSLWEFARSRTPSAREIVRTLVPFFTQIAKGMQYLHENNIILASCHPDHVYLKNNSGILEAQIGHIGRSIFLGKTQSCHGAVRIPEFHSDPDYRKSAARRQPLEVNKHGKYSFASDVASFALMMSETILVLSAPKDFKSEDRFRWLQYKNVSAEQVGEHQTNYPGVSLPEFCPSWLSAVIQFCLNREKEKQPKLAEVIACFESRRPEEHPVVAKAKDYVRENKIEQREEETLQTRALQQQLYEEVMKYFPGDKITKQLSRIVRSSEFLPESTASGGDGEYELIQQANDNNSYMDMNPRQQMDENEYDDCVARPTSPSPPPSSPLYESI